MAAAPERSDKHERDDRHDRNDKERGKAVELAVGQIEKQFGKGSIMRLGGKDAIAPIAAISTVSSWFRRFSVSAGTSEPRTRIIG
jgi:recombination protein RecA